MVLPEPMPMYLAEGSKCSFTACWAALRFEASIAESVTGSVLRADIVTVEMLDEWIGTKMILAPEY